jgi:hypothetical protein
LKLSFCCHAPVWKLLGRPAVVALQSSCGQRSSSTASHAPMTCHAQVQLAHTLSTSSRFVAAMFNIFCLQVTDSAWWIQFLTLWGWVQPPISLQQRPQQVRSSCYTWPPDRSSSYAQCVCTCRVVCVAHGSQEVHAPVRRIQKCMDEPVCCVRLVTAGSQTRRAGVCFR